MRRARAFLPIFVLVLASWSCTASHPAAPAASEDGDAPRTGSLAIPFRNGDLVPPAAWDPGFASRLVPSYAGGKVHAIVQFDRLLTADQRRLLRDAGLDLQDYLGGKAWFAAVLPAGPLATLDPAPRWAGEVLPAHRESPIVYGRSFDAYARARSGRVGLAVSFFADVPESRAREVLARHEAHALGYAASIHTFALTLPAANLDALAGEDAVKWIDQALPPFTPSNDGAREAVGVEALWDAPYDLSGSGVRVFVFDGDVVDGDHEDFGGRVTEGEAGGYYPDHPTHVAGTIGGSGAESGGQYSGMAPGVTFFSMMVEFGWDEEIFIHDDGDIEADYNTAIDTQDVDLANNSIGSNVGFNGYSCAFEGDYTTSSALIDGIVRGSLGRAITVVWSNGNERIGACGSSYGTTGPPATAKNPIFIGALNSEDDSMTDFSSWGPTDDGRMRPDVSAPGCQENGDGGIMSTAPGGGYQTMCGTSMSGPVTTGVAALMIEQWNRLYDGAPRNATIKAALINTAVDRGPAGPDYQFGYGRIDAQAAVDVVRDERFKEDQVAAGGQVQFGIAVLDGRPLRISLAWDDPPGTPNTNDNLVNDLDLTVLTPSGATLHPWLLNPSNPSAPATTGTDTRNNTEQVYLASPAVGVYTVYVTGTAVAQGPQAFSVASSHGFGATSYGTVSFDAPWYDLTDAATVTLTDLDLSGTGSQTVQARSDSHPAYVNVTVTEVAAGTGIFRGTLGIGTTLPVQHGDEVEAKYVDADDGQGHHNVTRTATATIDGRPPVFAGLAGAVGGNTKVTLAWAAAQDDSPVVYRVFRATSPGGEDFGAPLATTAELGYVDSDVTNGEWYFYVVRAVDALGHSDANTVERAAHPSGPVGFWIEDFETDTAGVDEWTIVSGGGADTWTIANPCERSDAAWSGRFFIADSDCAGTVDMDEQLISPPIDCSDYHDIELRFGHEFYRWTDDKGDVDVRVASGPWQNVQAFRANAEGTAVVDVSARADGQPDFSIRFHYYDANYAWWWGVDDISLWGVPNELPCQDADGDGFGSPAGPDCASPAEDCDDGNYDVNPGMPELCNGIDDNCADGIDEGGDVLCDDGYYCDGAETCAGVSGCQSGDAPCPQDETFCNGNETCDETADLCGHTGDPCAVDETCDEEADQCVPNADDDTDDDSGDDTDDDSGDDTDDDTDDDSGDDTDDDAGDDSGDDDNDDGGCGCSSVRG